MEELDPEIFGAQSGTPPPLATHCDVPLKYNKQRASLGIPSEGQYVSRGNPCKKELDEIKNISGINEFNYLDLAKAQNSILNKLNISYQPVAVAEWKQQQRVASSLWQLNLDSINSTSMLPKSDFTGKLKPEEEAYLLKQYTLKCFWEEGVLSSGSENFHPSKWWSKQKNGVSVAIVHEWKFYITKNLFVIASPTQNFLASRDHLLIISDLASQRYLLRLTSILENYKQRKDFISLEELDKLIINGDEILESCGNIGYEYIYTLEPSCTSQLVGDIPVQWDPPMTFSQVVQEETQEIAEKLHITALHRERESLISQYSSSPILLAQVYGLYRLWGHPTLEPLEGTSALKAISTKVRGYHSDLGEEISNKFKEEFIIRYIKKEHKWPPLNVESLSPYNPLRIAYEKKGPYPKHHKNYHRECLSLVDFEQVFPIDPKFDLVEMIADKAMSLNTPELIDRLKAGKGVGSAIDRSVLVQWLKSSLHDPVEFLKFIDNHGFTAFEESLGVKEKEREGKIKARLYGLMTIMKRMYIVLTEALIAEHLLQYFPEITMTDDEISLDKKRLRFNSIKLRKRSICTSIDFAKWNSNMREAETKGLFKALDQLFGLKNCFQRTHEMFKSSFVYLLNGSYLPTYRDGKFIPDLGSWYGHLGGIEGLRQKGWTIWTVILILFASEDFPMQIFLMGQGDNQIIREVYPESMSPERQLEIHRKFMERLNDILSKIGPPLKMEETWASRDFYVYGKYLIYKGAPLPMYGKKICRMFRMCNEDYPTLESTISSLTANLSAAVASSYDPGLLLFIYYQELVGTLQLFWHSTFLQEKPLIRTGSQASTVRIPYASRFRTVYTQSCIPEALIQPDNLLIKFCLLPRCLGGLPITNIYNLIVRGFPDEVSFAISTLRLFHYHSTPDIKQFIENALNPPLNPDKNFTLLFEHPTSLNLDVPPTPSEARRNSIIRFLKTSHRVENPYLKTFLQLLDSPYEANLIKYLTTAEPFMPRLLAIISGATVESRARHIANRLQKTKTISTLARTEGEEDLNRLISSSEWNHSSNLFRFVSGQHKGQTPWNASICSVSHAQTLRDQGWGKKIEGVDCVPPQEFLFLENPGPTLSCLNSLDLQKGHISVRFDMSSMPDSSPLLIGLHNPYRGSVTKQKITGYGDKLVAQADPLLKKVFKAFDLIGWGVPKDGNISILLKQMLYSRTDLDPRYLMLDNDQISGSVHHRLQDERTGHGGSVAILPNFGTKFCFDTFPLSEYSKGSKNVNLMFQSMMSYGTTLLSWALSEGWTPSCIAIHMHVKSSCCIREINESLVDCSTIPPVCFLRQESSPYLYKKAESYLPESLQNQTILPNMEKPMSSNDYQRRLISALSQEILTSISPSSWDIPDNLDISSRLVINWCLRLPLLETLELVSLRLATHFIMALRTSSSAEYLLRLSEKVDRSPIRYWERLGNLIFCPNFQHEIVKEPYYSQISGNPCMSNTTLASNVKETCKTILYTWSSNLESRKRLTYLPMISSLYCGLFQHPSVLSLVKDWILLDSIDIKTIRFQIVTILKKEPLDPELILPSTNFYITSSQNSIFSETLDVLCKGSPDIPSLLPTPLQNVMELPNTCSTLLTLDSSDLINSESIIGTVESHEEKAYETHLWRVLASPTTGPYKGLSLIHYLFHNTPIRTLCLGDGSGGYTWSVLRLNNSSTVFYNSLISPSEFLEQSPPIPYIPSLAGWPEMESRVIQFNLTNDGINDITDPSFPVFLKTHLLSTFDGVICDAEISDRSNVNFKINLAISLINIVKCLNLKWAILKSYAGETKILRAQCSILLGIFNKVSIIRSDFSSHSNTEIYIYAREPTMNFINSFINNRLTGFILSDTWSPVFMDLREACEIGVSKLSQDTLTCYNECLHPTYDDILHSRLLSSIPFVFTQETLIYPHSTLHWLRTTCQLRPGLPSLHHHRLETHTFSNYLLARYSICWIFLAVSSGSVPFIHIPSILANSVLVWYYLQDGTWELAICDQTPPEELQGPTLLVWSLSSILTTKHHKLLYRMLGIASLLNICPYPMSNSINRGNLSARGKILPREKLPKNEWVMKNIFISTTSSDVQYVQPPSLTVKEAWLQRFSRRRRLHRWF